MYFLDFEDFEIAGASPESLVKVTGRARRAAADRRHAAARGDAPRRTSSGREELLADEKERAEHVMLVDLGRNDLGRVCEYGSVARGRADGRRDLLARDAHRLVGVRARCATDVTPMDALRASLPAGTLSGAPKIRAMQIIDELEPVRARALRRRGRLPLLHRRPRHLHLHPLGAGQGRARARPGGRPGSWPTPTPATRCARPRPRRARCSRRSRWPASRGTGRDPGPRRRQLRLVHLQPRPVPGRARGRGRGGAQRRRDRRDLLERAPDRVVVSPGPCTPAEAGVSVEAIRALRRGGHAGARRVPGPPGAGGGVRRRVVRGEPVHGKTAAVEHDGRTIFAGLDAAGGRPLPLAGRRPRPARTASSARRRAASVVMGLRHRELPAEGVQFHPESVLTARGQGSCSRNFLALMTTPVLTRGDRPAGRARGPHRGRGGRGAARDHGGPRRRRRRPPPS